MIIQRYRINREIQSREVRVIGPEGGQLGIMGPVEALRVAGEGGYDLVEVAPTANPPVCRIMDYGRFKYEQSKKLHTARQHQKLLQIKEVKFRPRTDTHDLAIKVRTLRGFLEGGYKTKVTVMFRGREMARPELGQQMMTKISAAVEDIVAVLRPPRMEGRNLSMVLGLKQSVKSRKPGVHAVQPIVSHGT